jgi:O-antigen/teichoic acid export membrane protein
LKPLRNILRLSAGDFLAKTLSFIAFVYAARVLGVATYGVLEFVLSVMTYFLLLADGGLELWATRAVAQGESIPALASRLVPLRLGLAVLAYLVLLLLVPHLPAYPALQPVLLLFGLTLFAQGASLKWVFMGREQMSTVALGLIVAQIVFALAILVTVHSAAGLVWIPLLRLAGDTAMAGYFGYLYVQRYGRLRLRLTLPEAVSTLRQALVMGGAHTLAQVSYNFDSVLLGLLAGSAAVGWYNGWVGSMWAMAATALLALPVSYFLGLFPVLSRTFRANPAEFQAILERSLRWLTILALPVGIGGVAWARPAVFLLFGPAYANAVVPLQVLACSAALVILRGTYRQALNAAGRQDLDLRCATIATGLNVALNLVLIPYFGIVGAATATLLSEILWLTLVTYYTQQHVTTLNLTALLTPALKAAAVASVGLWLMQPLWWFYQIPLTLLLYLGMLVLLGVTERRVWPFLRRLQPL